jgi:hypothetical protein
MLGNDVWIGLANRTWMRWLSAWQDVLDQHLFACLNDVQEATRG